MRRWLPLAAAVAVIAIAIAGPIGAARASDHDDGENSDKERALNLTDLYVFRECDQDTSASCDNLIFIMCANPRSVARQQYFFATNARYEFHVSRVAAVADTPTPTADVTLRFEFGAPATDNTQEIFVTAIRDGTTFGGTTTTGVFRTTPITKTGTAITINQVILGTTPSTTLHVFAGLREDPFFFDVESFFRVRAFLRGEGPDPRQDPGPTRGWTDPSNFFRPTATAVDFTAGYNVNAIVVRVPISFLKGSTSTAVFDVWETISVRR